jgi:NO-binding membrane sensor protein with MHYT domain
VIARYRAPIQLALACAALVGAGVCWTHARHIRGVAPVAEGQPATTSLVYDPQLLLLTMLLLTAAGVLAVLGIARLRRERRGRSTSP